MRSVLPPGGNPTLSRIGLEGYASLASLVWEIAEPEPRQAASISPRHYFLFHNTEKQVRRFPIAISSSQLVVAADNCKYPLLCADIAKASSETNGLVPVTRA